MSGPDFGKSGEEMIDRVRRALARARDAEVPAPPDIPEPVVRRVYSDIGLGELFVARAAAQGMSAELVYPEDVLPKLVGFLRQHGCARLGLVRSPLLDRLDIGRGLSEAGFEVALDPMVEQIGELDASITDLWCGLAETGGMVIRGSDENARSLALLPPVHVAMIDPAVLLPDLLDLFEKFTNEGIAGHTTLISGPGAGTDGPKVVQAYVLK